jgi:riboflavin biosynthesis pyrimidine reductase
VRDGSVTEPGTGHAPPDEARTDLGVPALELLYEPPGLPAFALPDALERVYGGTLGFEEPRTFANFVATIDGVVAIPSVPSSNKVVAAGSAADRFVLGLLRACADVLVIGAGTMSASPRSVWTAEQAFPPAGRAFAELRERLARPPEPAVAVISGTGTVDASHPAFAAGAFVLTSAAGAERLDGKLPAEAIVAVGDGVAPGAALAALGARGHRLILCEGGPHTIAPFLEARLVDELFLTVSPVLAGRPAGDRRLALVEGSDLLPGGPLGAHVLGVRREADHLFLRYALATPPRPDAGADPPSDA